ncbi:Uncharacterised protein [Amycolatopsis camponoti]|uniref:Putative Flp pilus-assembly TadG-like N-terminal domain-containing protein n=1 Tax=Amycolatopsis camponoti TaxID=2606593 RepID=A0A6I8M4A7_9PSEU|nr:Uncharacterised protein [Amycolatopsis camponoti]
MHQGDASHDAQRPDDSRKASRPDHQNAAGGRLATRQDSTESGRSRQTTTDQPREPRQERTKAGGSHRQAIADLRCAAPEVGRSGCQGPAGWRRVARHVSTEQGRAGHRNTVGRQRPARQDSGVATIWTAMAVAALAGVAVLGCWLGAAVLARHRAESAADLGALAAASHAADGPVRACERARWVADRMAVSLLTCRWQRLDAFVEVQAPSLGFAGLPGPSARARAGPAGPPP